MLPYMHCRIQDWVDSVCPADNPTAADVPTLESPRADWYAGPPAKRVCHGLDAAFHPSSPPLTEIMDDATPRGRKRPVQLEEMTPRPILSMRKRTSPTKRTTKTTLENLEKPFTFYGMPSRPLLRQRLPKDTIPLYEELFSATEKRAIIPAEMREELEDEGLSPNAFREADVAQGAQRRA